ncbi:MAG TPA: toll/interleukin-1 receptor domain-containing protein [Candidatus Dormibacteraeota bacterium]|nr:toll/interleukin-1 receptor domain-containing protein [Candidatus Dormibacteraeota bacterium]
MPPRLAFDAFLSHRYKSPAVNLYFYRMFTETASVQFRVDIGLRQLSTTRLEKLIRNVDAFIGIYSIPGDPTESPDLDSLMHLSRYFRLELDMAIRSRRPSIVFCDERYHHLFASLPGIQYCHYDAQEILSRSGSPARDGLKHQFRSFCRVVETAAKLRAMARPGHDVGLVGVLVPPLPDGRVDEGCARVIEQTIRETGCQPELLPWPAHLDLRMLKALRRCEWVIVETSVPESAAVVAFLHGQYIPQMRIRRAGGDLPLDDPVAVADRILFSGVGYNDEMLVWHDLETLHQGLRMRIANVLGTGRRINDAEQAVEYFRSAAQRKERVFLSYAGEDEPLARRFGQALRERFQEVFDYRDGKSIRHGRLWREEVFDNLSMTAVGIMLVSPAYLQSRYCREEAMVMMDRLGNGQVQVFPIILEDVALPSYLGIIQHRDARDHSATELVAGIIERLESADG